MRHRIKRPAGLSKGQQATSEEGAVLLFVLWLLALLSTLALGWAQEWRTEIKLTANFQAANQCRRLAEAGVYYALGKLVEAKMVAAPQSPLGGQDPGQMPPETWRGDHSIHVVDLPGGQVRVRVEDESGKLHLNRAPENVLFRLFTILGYDGEKAKIMVDSVLDWRTEGNIPRPYGAKSSFYLGLTPPYPAKNGMFEVVRELAWVRGFTSSFVSKLEALLTVQTTRPRININTAPLEVLQACGLSPEVAQRVMAQRQASPFRRLLEAQQILGDSWNRTMAGQLAVDPSSVFTIQSTGLAKQEGGRHTVRAVVRLTVAPENLWEIVSWIDAYPG